MRSVSSARQIGACALLALAVANAASAAAPRKARSAIRGVPQEYYVYDSQVRKPDAPAVIVVSGDGGWHGFIAEVAEYLADHGYPAVGVDAKEYLESLSKPRALEPSQVSGDFAALARFVKERTGAKLLVLIGWSEGAGLAVLGGLDPAVRVDLRGVVAIGLPELNELAWRWSDSVIYVTHKVPNEPTFNSKDYVGCLAPIPLMVIQSTHDEFVPLETARDIFTRARDPKQISFIDSENHRFEGQHPAFWQALDRALAWFESVAAKS
jgi:dienelactone hydrolase